MRSLTWTIVAALKFAPVIVTTCALPAANSAGPWHNAVSRMRRSAIDETTTLKWLASSGGPLLLLASEYLQYWEGSDPPTGGRTIDARFRWTGQSDDPATDYDRACDIDNYLGLVDVGPGQALVLGDAPLGTTWWPAAPGGGLLVRWRYAQDEASVVRALADIPEAIWEPAQFELRVGNGPLYLFDAAYPGAMATEYLVVELRSGHYAAATAVYEPDDFTALVLHRLSPRPVNSGV
jgi:hypothetical protein